MNGNYQSYPFAYMCFKHGKCFNLIYYHLISIVPVVAKVFEKIINNQLYSYLSEYYLILSCHSGFRSLHSTATTLLEATDNWAYNQY